MATIDVVVEGNGYAYVDNPNPTAQGEIITLYAYPYGSSTLDDIVAWEEHGYSVALYVQNVQTFEWRYQAMTIKVTFSSGTIDVTVQEGNGTAYVDVIAPLQGEDVTLYCIPDQGYKIKNILAWDENDDPVHLAITDTQTFEWQYQSLDIYVYFEPRGLTPHHMPIWMYPIFRT